MIEVQADEVERRMYLHASHTFDLSSGPLLEVILLQIGLDEHVLLVNMHHIISDAWSVGVMMRELQHFYAAQVARVEQPLAALPIQYADYACWQRDQNLALHLEYWKSALAGYQQGLNLPYDFARPPDRAWRAGWVRYTYPAALAERATRFSQARQHVVHDTAHRALRGVESLYRTHRPVHRHHHSRA